MNWFRCPRCNVQQLDQADPVQRCVACGIELVVVRMFDAIYAFVRSEVLER